MPFLPSSASSAPGRRRRADAFCGTQCELCPASPGVKWRSLHGSVPGWCRRWCGRCCGSVFAAGFRNVFGVAIVAPYDTYIPYDVYIAPGLIGMVLLFNGMQSSLAMVYDREMGLMRLLLTAPLPRWWLLLRKLCGARRCCRWCRRSRSCWWRALLGTELPLVRGWLHAACRRSCCRRLMLGALGLLLSVHIKQLENFAGTMNFVIFPMYFISTALYPLWKLEESGR